MLFLGSILTIDVCTKYNSIKQRLEEFAVTLKVESICDYTYNLIGVLEYRHGIAGFCQRMILVTIERIVECLTIVSMNWKILAKKCDEQI